MKISRRKFLYAVCGAGLLTGAYAKFWEARALEVSETEINLARADSTPAGEIRILHLSDFHASSVVPLEFIAESIELGLRAKPDIVLLTGDFITGRFAQLDQFSEILTQLSKRVPCFAVVGNHDGGDWAVQGGGYGNLGPLRRMLEKANIDLLINEQRIVRLQGRECLIVGVGDLWSNTCDPQRAFHNPAAHDVCLLLSHNPDSKDLLAPYPWDLMLAGHTHGGQLRIPFLGWAPFAPVVDKKFLAGLYAWKNRYIFISRGVGNLHGLRFNCRPEVSVLRVKI